MLVLYNIVFDARAERASYCGTRSERAAPYIYNEVILEQRVEMLGMGGQNYSNCILRHNTALKHMMKRWGRAREGSNYSYFLYISSNCSLLTENCYFRSNAKLLSSLWTRFGVC